MRFAPKVMYLHTNLTRKYTEPRKRKEGHDLMYTHLKAGHYTYVIYTCIKT
jgi:hypothetical protein